MFQGTPEAVSLAAQQTTSKEAAPLVVYSEVPPVHPLVTACLEHLRPRHPHLRVASLETRPQTLVQQAVCSGQQIKTRRHPQAVSSVVLPPLRQALAADCLATQRRTTPAVLEDFSARLVTPRPLHQAVSSERPNPPPPIHNHRSSATHRKHQQIRCLATLVNSSGKGAAVFSVAAPSAPVR